ncbi:MAG: hypothetical protein LBS25_04735 [Candidatus Symbiothrix sp.]|jgi:hypothetical protein|nr:hypothetical protein [Candidatus Symbiothrix sp.]
MRRLKMQFFARLALVLGMQPVDAGNDISRRDFILRIAGLKKKITFVAGKTF